ncbi:MAG TPA: hypothetical protein V6C58_16095 [Allocoleopsis sp.]
MEQTDKVFQPWLLVQLRLKKLQDCREYMTEQEYINNLADIQQDLMNLGEWWVGQEDQVF